MLIGLYATDNEFKKLVFGLFQKLKNEDYETIYSDMYEDIRAEDEARKAAREQYLAVLQDVTGHEAEYLLRA